MKTHRTIFILLITATLAATTAYSAAPLQFGPYTPDQFHAYWHNQGAEISRYALQQARYGEIHGGDAVLVFVTEPMNPAMQVKADHSGPQNIPVLKLNAVRKFFTGIYPYSIMTSVFTPVDSQKYPLPLKITSSTQEWCGQVYTQMNLRDDAYRVQMQSYFEKEGDQAFTLENDVPEDAIWTMIRIAPQTLPLGTFSMIPGTVYARLVHRPLTPQKATAALRVIEGKSLEGNALARYEISFPTEQRTLRIDFEREFPYRIQKWDHQRHPDAHPHGCLLAASWEQGQGSAEEARTECKGNGR